MFIIRPFFILILNIIILTNNFPIAHDIIFKLPSLNVGFIFILNINESLCSYSNTECIQLNVNKSVSMRIKNYLHYL